LKTTTLNFNEVRKKLIEKNSYFQSKLITLPNILVLRWVSNGYSFQNKFKLDTDLGIEKYAYWCLRNKKIFNKLTDLAHKYFIEECHKLNTNNTGQVLSEPTALMALVWNNRDDLQSLFPKGPGEDNALYWNWWLNGGADEYEISNKIPLETSAELKSDNIIKLLVDIFWSNQEGLKEIFKDPLNEDYEAFVFWWINNHGSINIFDNNVYEHFIKEQHKLNIKNTGAVSSEPTALMKLVWRNRDDLQNLFPKGLAKDSHLYWNWWLNGGANEYKVSNKVPLDITPELKTENIIQLLVDLFWSNQECLKETFKDPLNKDYKDFVLWWINNHNNVHIFDYNLYEYFIKEYHKLNITNVGKTLSEPTELMKLVWNKRSDLQGIFPKGLEEDNALYWNWWLNGGADEYKVSNKVPLEINTELKSENIIKLLVDLFWINREDLKETFKDPLNEDYEAFVFWWINNHDGINIFSHNLYEHFIKEEHKLNIKNTGAVSSEPTALMKLIWNNREYLQSLFPKGLKEDSNLYWNWWLNGGADEYDVANKIPLEINTELKTENIIQLLVDIFWGNRKDLQETFKAPLNEDYEDFISWWINNYTKEYPSQYNKNEVQIEALITTKNISLESKGFEKNKISVALIGHPTGIFGLGEDARLIKKSLEFVGINVDAYIANPNINTKQTSINTAKNLDEYESIYDCNIFCIPAFDMLGLALDYDLKIFTSTINIGVWQWELSKFPDEANFSFELVHKVLSISDFAATSISKNTTKDVHSISLPIIKETFKKRNRQYFSLPENNFLYFFSFDGGSFINRKNPLAIIESFQRAFKEESDVGLIIKVMNAPESSDLWNECIRRSLCDKRIFIINKSLDRSDFLALLNNSDIIISLHRAEGFGRLMAEAFIYGKTSISSSYSGNLEYMNEENSYLVNGKVIPLFRGDYLFSNNKEWFEPNINHAASLMNYTYENRAENEKKALLGKKNIENIHNIENTGNQIKKEIINLLNLNQSGY